MSILFSPASKSQFELGDPVFVSLNFFSLLTFLNNVGAYIFSYYGCAAFSTVAKALLTNFNINLNSGEVFQFYPAVLNIMEDLLLLNN